MKVFSFIAALGAVATVNAAQPGTVTVGTDDNFDGLIAENTFVLAEFYAPWCGHCKSLAPEYDSAAAQLEGTEDLLIVKVDATEEKGLAEKFAIQGFPTLKWFVNGDAQDYSGGRTADTIVSWIKKKTGPPCAEVNSAADLDALKADNKVVAVGVFNTDEEKAAFQDAAMKEEKIPYGVSVGNADVATAAGVTAPAVIVFRTFDEPEVKFDGDTTSADEITKFVQANGLPLIIPFSQDSAPQIFGGEIKQFIFAFIDSDKADETSDLESKLNPVAKEQKGTMSVITVDKSEDRILEFFGLTPADIPAIKIVDMAEGMKKYGMSGDITTDTVSKLAKDFLAGELAPELKSEDIPSEQGDVYVLVGKDWDNVIGTGKDVLVEFYAPWCGHCKKLEPIYEELGKKYADNDDLIIAKMDATANEVEVVQVQGFPTIKFFPKDGEMQDYEGGRDLAGFVEFLEKNAASLK